MLTKLVWKTIHKVEPGLKESETIDGYFFQNNPDLGTVVETIHETSAFDKTHPSASSEYEYAEETLSRLEAEQIRNILIKRMIYQRAFRPINITLINRPELINRKQLKQAGVELRRPVGKSLEARWMTLDVGDSLAESEAFWASGFQGNLAGQGDEILRIASWFLRSVEDRDEINSFISAWIGFNGLYNLLDEVRGPSALDGDASKFEAMAETLINAPQAVNIVASNSAQMHELASYDITSERGNTNWSLLLAKALRNGTDNSQILKLTLRCIYGVRKQVFHEAPRTTDISKRAEVSRAALLPIGFLCLKNMVNL